LLKPQVGYRCLGSSLKFSGQKLMLEYTDHVGSLPRLCVLADGTHDPGSLPHDPGALLLSLQVQ
jgi:hypothetical protein